jgi:hypothetical protein
LRSCSMLQITTMISFCPLCFETASSLYSTVLPTFHHFSVWLKVTLLRSLIQLNLLQPPQTTAWVMFPPLFPQHWMLTKGTRSVSHSLASATEPQILGRGGGHLSFLAPNTSIVLDLSNGSTKHLLHFSPFLSYASFMT